MAQSDHGSWEVLPLAIQSFALEEFDVNDVVKYVKKLGLKRVEFFHGHVGPSSSADQIAEANQVLQREGVSISAYGLYTFTANDEKNRRAFDFARKEKIKNIIAEVDPNAFSSLNKLVEEYGIRICLHTSGPGSRYEKLDVLSADLKEAHELIGSCLDTGHILRGGGDPVRWIHALGSRVFALHLTDIAEKAVQTFNMPLGQGHLDLDGIRDALFQVRFPIDGSIAVGYRAYACARLLAPFERPHSALSALIQSVNALLGDSVVAWPPSAGFWI